MQWECSECGATTTAGRKPVACDECGTAGIIFVELGQGNPEAAETADVREAWVDAGLRLAASGSYPAPYGF
jgi:hypothetical protein